MSHIQNLLDDRPRAYFKRNHILKFSESCNQITRKLQLQATVKRFLIPIPPPPAPSPKLIHKISWSKQP